MPSKQLHIVSFDVPYPPNYGGVIDVFYKLKALHQLGVQIIFHCFEYGRGEAKALRKYCREIHYYDRNSFFTSLLSSEPFVVKSRANIELIANLNKDSHPVLFEGLHTTYPIVSKQLINKKVYVRAHNIEHDFYAGLAKSEENVFKKRFFKQEAKKLKKYEKLLSQVHGVFTIAPYEQHYFEKKYGAHCVYIPAFHDHKIRTKLDQSEPYVLYHGNISVSDNARAVKFLIDCFKNSDLQLKIASGFENVELQKLMASHSNIEFINIEDTSGLTLLFEKAQVHVLPTFQKTGIKLKLLNTLYQGRHIVVNDLMVEDTGLEGLCHIANTKTDLFEKSKQLIGEGFSENERKLRFKALEAFHPLKAAQKMSDVIFQ